MRITIRRTQDGHTPQTAPPAAQVKMVYMHWEDRPTFVVDTNNQIYHQAYCEMYSLGDTNPVYVRGRWTPFQDICARREWYAEEVIGAL